MCDNKMPIIKFREFDSRGARRPGKRLAQCGDEAFSRRAAVADASSGASPASASPAPVEHPCFRRPRAPSVRPQPPARRPAPHTSDGGNADAIALPGDRSRDRRANDAPEQTACPESYSHVVRRRLQDTAREHVTPRRLRRDGFHKRQARPCRVSRLAPAATRRSDAGPRSGVTPQASWVRLVRAAERARDGPERNPHRVPEGRACTHAAVSRLQPRARQDDQESRAR